MRTACALVIFLLVTPAFAQTAPKPMDPTPAEPAPGTPAEADDAPADANPGFAQLKVDLTPKEDVTVGDRVRADLELVWMGPEPAAAPRFPTWQDTWGGAEVLDVSEVDAFTDQSGRRIYRQTVTLTAFKVGDVRLPPVTVAVPLADRTEELKTPADVRFTIVTVLPGPKEEAEAGDAAAEDAADAAPATLEPRPAAPPATLAPGTLHLWVVGALAVLCALAAARLLRLSPAAAGTAAAVPRAAPLAELLERLRALDPSQGSEPVHTGLSLAMRDYLGRLLGIHALEGTTSEIQRNLRATAVPPALGQRTVRLLRDCDQVKFAGLEVDDAVTDTRVALAQTVAREIQDTAVRQAQALESAAAEAG
jgi:hypothetical protein